MDKIPTKEEFLNSKAEASLLKLLDSKKLTLSRAIKELEKGNQHLLGVPNNDEVIKYVSDMLETAGWKTEVVKKTLKQENVKTHKEYERVNVSLKFI